MLNVFYAKFIFIPFYWLQWSFIFFCFCFFVWAQLRMEKKTENLVMKVQNFVFGTKKLSHKKLLSSFPSWIDPQWRKTSKNHSILKQTLYLR